MPLSGSGAASGSWSSTERTTARPACCAVDAARFQPFGRGERGFRLIGPTVRMKSGSGLLHGEEQPLR